MLIEWKDVKKEIEVSGVMYPATFRLPFLCDKELAVGDFVVSNKAVVKISGINYGMKDKEGKIFIQEYKMPNERELSKKQEIYTLFPMIKTSE